MDVQRAIALVIFLFPLAYSPGPGNAFFASVGASRGLRAAILSLLGYHFATFVITLAIGLGLETTILTDPTIMRMLGLVGGAYVIWIGVQFVRNAWSATSDEAAQIQGGAERVTFVDGAIVLLFNPKAYVIIGLLFTQFLQASSSDRFGQVLSITTIFTLNNMVAFIVWTIAGVAIAAALKGQAAHRNLNLLFGACLIVVGLWMIASTH